MKNLVSVKTVVKTKKLSVVVPEALALRMEAFDQRTKKLKSLDIHLDEAIADSIDKLLERAETDLEKIESELNSQTNS